MSTERSPGFDETTFIIGVLGGTLVLGVGFVFLVLGLSVGVREVGTLGTGRSRLLLMAAGAAAFVVGLGVRRLRERFDAGMGHLLARHGGSAVSFAGVTALLIGFSAEQTNSAPFLTSMNQKVLLVVIALATLTCGWLIIRLAGRRIGW